MHLVRGQEKDIENKQEEEEKHVKRLMLTVLVLAISIIAFGATASAAPNDRANSHSGKPVCMIPNGGDVDNNGIGDVGVQVVCNYTSVYATDLSGAYYWDLGDGRVQGTVSSIDELDQSTLSVCDYQVNTKGDFGNTPFLDSGVISNQIHCYGYDGNATFTYQIVHRTDPRFTGNPEWAEYGGSWEYHVYTISGQGNLVHRPPAVANVN